jgi:hypothetical protein
MDKTAAPTDFRCLVAQPSVDRPYLGRLNDGLLHSAFSRDVELTVELLEL